MQGLLLAGRYRLADSIGSGGMGRVWRAHDELLHRAVAIKELTAALYVSEGDRTILLARTRAEARAAARINHSAVVTVHDVLEHDGRPWIVMELVEGRSLADAIKEDGRVEPAEAARIGLWVLRALRAAHSAGVLHRDVKPGNVLLGHDGRVLLTDFGIAQIEGDTTITRTGEVVGSVDYLAPERVRGHDPGSSSDLWALGATLYTAVEGRSPFRRTSPLTTLQAVVEEQAAQPSYAGPLEPVITALLRKDPAARPDTAEAEQLLAEAAEGRRPSAAQAWVPTQFGGTDRGAGGMSGTGGTAGTGTAYGSGSSGVSKTSALSAGQEASTSVPMTTGPTAVGGVGTVDGAVDGVDSGPTYIGPNSSAVAAASTASPASHDSHASHTSHGSHASPRPPRRRRRRRTLVLALVVAALIGGGTAVALQKWDAGRQEEAGGAPGSTATGAPAEEGSDSDSWSEIHDPFGFGLSLPKGWERKVYQDDGDLKQVDYSPDGGEHFVRIALDKSPDFSDPYAHQVDLEQQIDGLVDYHQVTLKKNVYRDRAGSEWEYTWTAQAKDTAFPGPRRAIEETYDARDGSEYAVYMSSPAQDWATTAKQFKAVLQSWREPTSSS
ncbi:serine/threonine protein kinase [Streptomyces sp. NBC_01275]|uniref:serine/threonine-protein kinase n=1 Tax=Streptomyces sp. NBC_01275 TaxID=2903807 RepID=UPI002252936D|nr:serine/threonine-protein kinase [Streptomyces sp. NBC_01275]MCX4764424.1 serine/threonine protein kinase [Streptomyces sp. NBC_01275]